MPDAMDHRFYRHLLGGGNDWRATGGTGRGLRLHNSLFLIAHFHNVIIGGVVFGCFAGMTYWWPKAFGFTLNETWGIRAFWFWIIGFFVAFMPLYTLGFMGMTRRLSQHIDPQFHPC